MNNALATDLDADRSEPLALQRALAGATPFADLGEAVLAALEEICDRRFYPAGETIYSAGQYDGSEAFVVLSGEVRVSQTDPQTGSLTVENFRSGDTIGLAAAIAGSDPLVCAQMTIAAAADSDVAGIDVAAFAALVAQRPSLTKNLMHYFAGLIARQGAASPHESSPERRVYAELMGLVQRDAVLGEWRIAKMPKHRELADQAGVEESLAAAAVARLIQSSVARRDYPGLIIDDIAALDKLAH